MRSNSVLTYIVYQLNNNVPSEIMLSKKLLHCISGLRTSRRFYDVAAAVSSTKVPEKHQATEEILSDAFGRKHDYLRISLTEKCNLRCKYCMPAEGVTLSPRERLLSTQETIKLARVFASLGVRSIRLTGGEPTLRKDLEHIVHELKSIAGIERVAMTTNGLTLTRILPALQRAGLDALNISLDSLRPERYETLARRPGSNLKRVLAGIDLAIQLGYRPVKINTVLMRGINDDEIFDFVEMTRNKEVEVYRVHAVCGERVGGCCIGAGAHRASSSCGPVRTYASTHSALLYITGMERGWSQRKVRDGGINDPTILPWLQPPAPYCRRTTEGLFVWRRGTGLTRGAAFRGGRRGSKEAHPTSSDGQEVTARRYGKFGSYEKSSYDSNRRLRQINYVEKRNYSTGPKNCNANENQENLTTKSGKKDENLKFSHVDNTGKARMVDVGDKPITKRIATASCYLTTNSTVLKLLREHKIKKGDAIAVSEVAGVMAAKRTADLIPLCHTLPLDSVKVTITLPKHDDKILIECTAQCTGRTGVEMEALTGVSVAALTLYDMCKAVDKRMVISDLKVLSKFGGRNDFCFK